MADLITVCIEIDDQGAISVGTMPKESEDAAMPAQAGGMTDLAQPQPSDTPEATEDAGMQPAKSIDEALSIARGLLRTALQGGDGATMGGEPGGEGAQSSADAAFKARRGYKAGM